MRISDWSSDVCSSDLGTPAKHAGLAARALPERCRAAPAPASTLCRQPLRAQTERARPDCPWRCGLCLPINLARRQPAGRPVGGFENSPVTNDVLTAARSAVPERIEHYFVTSPAARERLLAAGIATDRITELPDAPAEDRKSTRLNSSH